jgi:organic radical activating enzyme
MNPDKLHLRYVEFYITNACNFNCVGCNRFNNYNFSGTQKWSDYADLYQRWSSILNLDKWTILGGEPMMNPTYLDWLENICKLWPNSQGELLTNGYFLKSDNRKLYDILEKNKNQVVVGIGLHNKNRVQEVLETVNSWLSAPVTVERIPKNIRELENFDRNWVNSYNAIRDVAWPDCNTIDEWPLLPEHIKKECHEVFNFSPELLAESNKGWKIVDKNGVCVIIKFENFFHQGALKVNGTQSFKLHNSDPEKAHSICHSKQCHHFDKGQLYKCGQVALFKEIDQQFYLEVTDQDRQLFHSYQPGDVDQDFMTLKNFVNNLDNSIPQCKFCPENYVQHEVFATHQNKVKMTRKEKQNNG